MKQLSQRREISRFDVSDDLLHHLSQSFRFLGGYNTILERLCRIQVEEDVTEEITERIGQCLLCVAIWSSPIALQREIKKVAHKCCMRNVSDAWNVSILYTSFTIPHLLFNHVDLV